MKRGLILLIALFGSVYLGCRQQEVRLGNVQSDTAAVVNASQMPEDGSAIVRTENGTVIKKSGWQLPVPLTEDKQYHATTVVVEGRKVEVLNSPFFPEENLVVRIPNLSRRVRDPPDHRVYRPAQAAILLPTLRQPSSATWERPFWPLDFLFISGR